MRNGFALFSCLFFFLADCKKVNRDFDYELSKRTLEFAAAAYSIDPEPCISKNNATLLFFKKVECDYMRDEVKDHEIFKYSKII